MKFHIASGKKLKSNKSQPVFCKRKTPGNRIVDVPADLPQGYKGCFDCYVKYRRLPFAMIGHY